MTTRIFVAIIALLTVFTICGSAYEADAARFGGGRSFGGASRFSKPVPSARVPNTQATNPSSSATQRQPGAASAAPAARGFGMGGLVGGLLAGSLIGSLLAGNGFGGGGMIDMLLIGFGLYLLFKLLGRRRAGSNAQTSPSYSSRQGGMTDPDPQARAMEYSSGPSGQTGQAGQGLWGALNGQQSGETTFTDEDDGLAPRSFDREEFLRGAKMIYTRMNTSWDQRNLDDIAEFSTQAFMAEIRRQAEEDPDQERTDILLVNAKFMGVIEEAGRETASVYFDVSLQEQGARGTTQVQEVWHFVRAAKSNDMWRLEGIQQVE